MIGGPSSTPRPNPAADPSGAVTGMLDAIAAHRPDVAVVTGARGSGKTRLLQIARLAAVDRAMTVLATSGAAAPVAVAYQGLQDLVRPHVERLDALVPDHAPDLRQLAAGRTLDLDAGAVRTGFLELLRGLAVDDPVCVVVDDLDLVDRESIDILMFALARVEGCRVGAVVSARGRLEWNAWRSIVLDPLPDEHVTAVLAGRGVAAGPARACARAAGGLPGMAIALADGLTHAQRTGAERLPALIRPARSLIEHQQAVLGTLDPSVQRALVVVAADELGQITPIRTALGVLGEVDVDAALEAAECHGVIEIEGLAVRFTDPWWRPAAYYLVAPASRRAAHRALAESYAEPHQAVARAWQLAAATTAPSDPVADALGLVAAGLARRGRTAEAVDTYARAIEFAASAAVRDKVLLGALQAALDGLELDVARELAAQIDPSTCEAAIAVAETAELTGLPSAPLPDQVAMTSGAWARRRRARLEHERAIRGGRAGDAAGSVHPAHAQLAAAHAHRHAGRLVEARDALVRLEGMLNPSCTELLAAVQVLHADLDQLAGRYEQAAARLRTTAPAAAGWTRQLAEWIALRLESSVEASSVAPWTDRAGVDVAADALSSVRAMIARGSRSRDRQLLGQAVRRASSLGFPIEACEAELALLEATLAAGRPVDDDQQRDLADRLWHLGVHGWDRRLAAVEARAVRTGEADLSCLSQAERRVADAVGQGMTNREAAASLFLSVKTVDFHLQQIYRKLAVRSRTELAVLLHGDDHRARALAVR